VGQDDNGYRPTERPLMIEVKAVYESRRAP
jgi:hypothetical protein